jgi:hypothetical protein
VEEKDAAAEVSTEAPPENEAAGVPCELGRRRCRPPAVTCERQAAAVSPEDSVEYVLLATSDVVHLISRMYTKNEGSKRVDDMGGNRNAMCARLYLRRRRRRCQSRWRRRRRRRPSMRAEIRAAAPNRVAEFRTSPVRRVSENNERSLSQSNHSARRKFGR